LKRKLIVLNLVLAAAIAATVWRLRSDWVDDRAREQALLSQRVRPQPAPIVSKSPAPQPVAAIGYAEIAEKMLFSKDRNPTVVVEATPPPPPKPMPHLPVLYGVMNLLDSTTAIMGVKSGAHHQAIRPGEQIGEFTLIAIDNQAITLEWDGKEITKPVEEMIDRSATAPAADPAAARAAPTASTPTAPPPAQPKGEAAPGTVLTDRLRACQPGDASPPGTVSGGFKKVVTPSPFGNMCRWEPI
jgi:hypothetical protein